MVGQLSFIRLTAQTFYGNELTMGIALGHWLFWTGIGSIIGARLVVRLQPAKYLKYLSAIYGLFLIIFYDLLILLRNLIGISNTELVGMGTIFLWTQVIYCLPSVINGFFFPFFVKWLSGEQEKRFLPYVYAAEVFGSATGSLIFATLLILGMNTYQILHLFIGFLIIICVLVTVSDFRKRTILLFLILIPLLVLLVIGHNSLQRLKWRPFTVTEYHESPHLSLTTISYQGSQTIYGDSEPIWTFGEKEKAEELVHFALLSIAQPESILIIGVGSTEITNEIAQYKSITYIEIIQPDRVLQSLLDSHDSLSCPKIQIKKTVADPIMQLNKYKTQFDVILLNIPAPVNAQWNRLYTCEFFRLAHDHLKETGVLSIPLSGSETFLSKEHVNFLKSIENSAFLAFQNIAWIPGETVYLLASDSPIKTDYRTIADAICKNNLHTLYIRDYFLSDRLSERKVRFLQDHLNECRTMDINRLSSPIGYYYDTILWGQRTGGWLKPVYLFLRRIPFRFVILGFAALMAAILFKVKNKKKSAALVKMKMFSVGFIIMSLESILIIVFQSYVGAVYFSIVLLMFTYMAGAGIGSLSQLQIRPGNYSKALRISFVGLGFLSLLIFITLRLTQNPIFIGLFAFVILFLSGTISGVVFPIFSFQYQNLKEDWLSSSGGKIYASDILGATLGVYLTSCFIIPVWGLYPAVFLSLLISTACIVTSIGHRY